MSARVVPFTGVRYFRSPDAAPPDGPPADVLAFPAMPARILSRRALPQLAAALGASQAHEAAIAVPQEVS